LQIKNHRIFLACNVLGVEHEHKATLSYFDDNNDPIVPVRKDVKSKTV